MANQKVKVILQAPSKKTGLADQIIRVELDKEVAKNYLDIHESGMVAKVVQTLPATGENGVLYLVPRDESSVSDDYDEYLWVQKEGVFGWEKIGATHVDLDDYYTKDEVDTKIEDIPTGIPADATFWGAQYNPSTNKVAGNLLLENSSDLTLQGGELKLNYVSDGVQFLDGYGNTVGYFKDNGNTMTLKHGTGPSLQLNNQKMTLNNYGNNTVISGVADPVASNDVATKNYVDSHSGGGGGDIQVIEIDFNDIVALGQVDKTLNHYVPGESYPRGLQYVANTTTGEVSTNAQYTAAINLADYITASGVYKIKIKNYHFDTTENAWRTRYIAMYNKPSDYTTMLDWYTGISFFGFYGQPVSGQITQKQEEFLITRTEQGYMILGNSPLAAYGDNLTLFYLPLKPNNGNTQILDSNTIYKYSYLTLDNLKQLYYPDWNKHETQTGYIHNRPFYKSEEAYDIYHDEWGSDAYKSSTTNPNPDYDFWSYETMNFTLYNALTNNGTFSDGDTVYMEVTFKCGEDEKTAPIGKFTASITTEEWGGTARLTSASDLASDNPWKGGYVDEGGGMGTYFVFPVLKSDDGKQIYITKVALWGTSGRYVQLDSNFLKVDNDTIKVNDNNQLYADVQSGGGGLPETTTFWGQTANNGVVNGRIKFNNSDNPILIGSNLTVDTKPQYKYSVLIGHYLDEGTTRDGGGGYNTFIGNNIVAESGKVTRGVVALGNSYIHGGVNSIAINGIVTGGSGYAGAVALLGSAQSGGVAIGDGAQGTVASAAAIGYSTKSTHNASVALGAWTTTSRDYEVSIGAGTPGSETQNQTRYLAHVKDPQYATDAANKRYVDSIYPVGAVFTSTSSTAPTIAGGTWTQIGTQTIGSKTVYYYERTA